MSKLFAIGAALIIGIASAKAAPAEDAADTTKMPAEYMQVAHFMNEHYQIMYQRDDGSFVGLKDPERIALNAINKVCSARASDELLRIRGISGQEDEAATIAHSLMEHKRNCIDDTLVRGASDPLLKDTVPHLAVNLTLKPAEGPVKTKPTGHESRANG